MSGHPLYIIGSGDLSTRAADLDASLERVFDVATAWKAIVLIDEVRFSLSISFSGLIRYAPQADVFLERRSLHNLERNATVSVL
jgi:hypothetical protein